MSNLTQSQAAHLRDAQTLHRLERIPEAIAAYQRLLAERSDLAECWFNLGVLQRRARLLNEALASYQKALDCGISGPEEVHLNRAVIYADYLRQDAAAEEELQRALALNARYLPAMLNLADLYEDLGRRTEAGAVYKRMLSIDPDCFEALARLANIQPLPPADDRLIGKLRAAVANPAAPLAARASLGYALGRLLDARGEYVAAFDAYTAANRDSRASLGARFIPYERARHERWIDDLIRTFDARSSADPAPSAPSPSPLTPSLPAPSPPLAGSGPGTASRPRPIFICGMFRSGSTLTEQLLAGHPDVEAGGELDFLPMLLAADPRLAQAPVASVVSGLPPAERLAGLAQDYLGLLAKTFPNARYVSDKRPDNFLRIGLIKRLFPDARIIHTRRDPLDTCLSIYFLHLDQQQSYALDLLDIGHYFRQYRRLMAHWQSLFSADIIDFDYDRFVRAPRAAAAELFTFLGLEWNDRYLDFQHAARSVRTASVWQVREALHQRSSGRASHYQAQLASLRDYLGDLLPS